MASAGVGKREAPIFRKHRCGSLGILAGLAATGAVGAADGGWSLSWSDEFEGPAVDAAVWGYESGYVRNGEDQYYTARAENSRIEDGALLIQARRDGWNGHAYTSASRTSRGRKSWRYGRFEMRARIDVRPGSWPAWWWLPDTGGWPRGGEIDMMEAYQGKCLFNVMDGAGTWSSPTRTVASLGGDRWARDYHTWVMEWDSLRIDLYLDGALMNHYPLERADGTGPSGTNPFRHAGYLIVNQAIGGTQGGDPSPTEFPVELRVAWIRVHTWTPGAFLRLQVENGSGGGAYVPGARVSLTAETAPAGRMFDRWVVLQGSVSIADSVSPDTRLILAGGDAAVKALYKAGTFLRPPGRAAGTGSGDRGSGGEVLRIRVPGSGWEFPEGRAWRTLSGRRLPASRTAPPAAGAYLLAR